MCDDLFDEQFNNNSCFDKNASLVIKKEAIVNNVKCIKDKTGAKIIAVVKENGYGLGVANLYNIIKDQDIFMYAVTSPCEAVALRREGCREDYFDVIVIRKTTNIFSFTFWFEKKKRVVKRVDLTAPIYAKLTLFSFLRYFSRRDCYLFVYFILALIGPAALLFGYVVTAVFVIPVFFMTTIHIYFGIIKKMHKR